MEDARECYTFKSTAAIGACTPRRLSRDLLHRPIRAFFELVHGCGVVRFAVVDIWLCASGADIELRLLGITCR
jgi:hypothetical protein